MSVSITAKTQRYLSLLRGYHSGSNDEKTIAEQIGNLAGDSEDVNGKLSSASDKALEKLQEVFSRDDRVQFGAK